MEKLIFKIHTPNAIKDTIKYALRPNQTEATIVLQVLQRYLVRIASRAQELNDEKLNAIMLAMALYEEGDPTSEFYNPELVEQLMQKHLV